MQWAEPAKSYTGASNLDGNERPPEVTISLAALEETTERALKQAHNILERLQVVLRHESEKEASGPAVDAISTTPLANRIDSIRRNVFEIEKLLNTVNRRLEI